MMKRILFLIAILFSVAGCTESIEPPEDAFQEIVIPAGKHSAIPYWYSFDYRQNLKMQHVFTASCKYEISEIDQIDWNKLSGLSFHYFTNHKDAAMVSWRWNPVTELIELGAYYHRNRERIIARVNDTTVLATAKIGVGVKTEIIIEPWLVSVCIETPTDTITHSLPFTTNTAAKTRIINAWFGGNQVAPHDIYILRKQIY